MTIEINQDLQDGLGGAAETMIVGAAKNLSQLLSAPVDFKLATITSDGSVTPEDVEGGIALRVEFGGALDGASWFSLSADDAKNIVKMMTAGMEVDENDLLGELGMSALSEAMNQLMAGSATALSEDLGERIDISPPIISTGGDAPPSDLENAVVISYEGEIAGEASSMVHWQIDYDLAKDLARRWTLAKGPAPAEPDPVPSATPAAEPQPQTVPAAASPVHTGVVDTVELDVAVELGSTSLTIQELLRLREGNVVALAQSVGDDVSMLVNGTPIASGDVVVVDGTLGFRVSALITAAKGA